MKLLCIILLILQINLAQPPAYEFKSVSGLPQTEQVETGYRPDGPRKVSGLGWLDWYAWGQYNGVPRDASNEDMYAYYKYRRNGGALSWNDWYNSHNVPVGDSPIGLVLLLGAGYVILTRAKNPKYKS